MKYATHKWSRPQNHWRLVFGFGPQNPCEVLMGTRGTMWHHHKTCVYAMQSREELVVVRSTNLELDHSAFRIKWCTSNYLGIG